MPGSAAPKRAALGLTRMKTGDSTTAHMSSSEGGAMAAAAPPAVAAAMAVTHPNLVESGNFTR